ncbi:MAG: nuclear transport factor 2 family protein [Bacteroidota bacterium]
MKFLKTTLITLTLLGASLTAQAQSDMEAVRATAMDYIEGTANGELDRLRRAFHEDAALYGVNNDGTMRRIPIDTYIGYFKDGEKNDRDGKIVSVDVVNNAANVKIEILSGPWKYTDYLLLLKLEGEWKIINKSYTRVRQ